MTLIEERCITYSHGSKFVFTSPKDRSVYFNIREEGNVIQVLLKNASVIYSEWVNYILDENNLLSDSKSWNSICVTYCYYLWFWRNKAIHDDTFHQPDHALYVEYYRDCFCLNMDGASKQDGNVASCEGIVRDSVRNWICGFAKHLELELWGVLEGLSMANARNISQLELHLNVDVVMRHLNNLQVGSVIGWRLLKRIRLLFAQDWVVHIKLVYREATKQGRILCYMKVCTNTIIIVLKSVTFKKGSGTFRLEECYCIQITRTKKDTTLYFDSPNQPNNQDKNQSNC